MIKTLATGKYAPGEHVAEWDGRNEAGQQVASGVYFYTLRAGSFRQTKKMLLLE